MPELLRVGRNTLLHKHPALRYGVDTERNVFWIISSLLAMLVLLMLITDTFINRNAILESKYRIFLTAAIVLSSCFWVFIPIVLKKRFPHWLGLIGYTIMMLVIGYHLLFSNDSFSINTALQILPVTSLYIGWFWRPTPSRIIFFITLAGLVLTSILGDHLGSENGLPYSVIVFALLLSTFAFLVGLFLRWKLQRKAMTDQLTGALNLRGIRRALRIDMARAKRFNEPLSVVAIDFDGFKELNDTKGHAFGDQVLVRAVKKWNLATRTYDKIGRVGGDEFLILFPKTDSLQAQSVIQRFKDQAGSSWSYGVAQLTQDDTPETLLKRADQDLYLAKQTNKAQTAARKLLVNAQLSSDLGIKKPNLIKAWYKNQSDYSFMSLILALVSFISLLAMIFFNRFMDLQKISLLTTFSILSAIIFGTLAAVLGRRYPLWLASVHAATILLFVIIFLPETFNFYGSSSLLYATSIVALYLGVFVGTAGARLVQISAVLSIGIIFVHQTSLLDSTDLMLIAIASVLYTMIAQMFLFEVGSYLYSRSQLHAHHDELTTVLNRHGLEEYGETELQRSVRGSYPISFAVADCINFKKVNDTHGHAFGDFKLQETAKYLVDNLDIYDLVARTGGDEFVIILPYLNSMEAREKLEEILTDAPLAMSLGVAEHTGTEHLSDVIKRADTQMYQERLITQS